MSHDFHDNLLLVTSELCFNVGTRSQVECNVSVATSPPFDTKVFLPSFLLRLLCLEEGDPLFLVDVVVDVGPRIPR